MVDKNSPLGRMIAREQAGKNLKEVQDKLADEGTKENYEVMIKEEQVTQMATLKGEAQAYEPQQTLNIADLPEVNINEVEILQGEGIDKEGKTFEYKYFKKDGKEYRVPNTVLEEIQKILKLKPTVTKVKVNKTGTGLATRYTVDALD